MNTIETLMNHQGPGGPAGAQTRRLRLAELTSGFGAGILGLGLGVLAAGFLSGLGWPVLIAGLLLHTWGMTDKHRLEAAQGAPTVWWSTLFYWICWVFLGGLTVYVVVRAWAA